jgi:hypothetical protein
MFENLYRSGMKHGSRILFAAAVLMPVVGVAAVLSTVKGLGAIGGFQEGWLVFVSQLFMALSSGVMPLLGALLVDRLDRWLSRGRQAAIPREDEPEAQPL